MVRHVKKYLMTGINYTRYNILLRDSAAVLLLAAMVSGYKPSPLFVWTGSIMWIILIILDLI